MIFHTPSQRHRVRLRAAATPLFALGGGTEQNMQFMLGIIVLCIAIGLFLGLLSWRARRMRRAEGQRRDEVMETLQRVMAQDNRLDMYPVQRAGNANAPTLSGRCVTCSPDRLQLDCALLGGQRNWPHTAIDVFFHEVADSGVIFYSFTAYIRKAIPTGDRLLVELPLPAYLRRDQKRALFRIAPQQDDLSALALWRMDDEQAELEETNSRDLGAPLCMYRRQKINQAAVLDLSAGGARLRLDADRCRQLPDGFQAGDMFIMLAVFADQPGVSEPRQFWFKCQCRHAGILAGSDDPYIGLQFQAWGMTQKPTDPIVWNDVEELGDVPPLFEWLVAHARPAQAETGNRDA
jgi:hypothetical protein